MLNTALLSRMSQKSQDMRYEEIILGRTCCEEAPQFVPAWWRQTVQKTKSGPQWLHLVILTDATLGKMSDRQDMGLINLSLALYILEFNVHA